MNKYKKLMGNTLIFALGNFGAKFLSFFLVRLYTFALTEEEYSTADLLYNTLNVLVPIVTFAMSDGIIRFGLDNEYDKRKVYTTAVLMNFIGVTTFALTTPIWNATSFYNGYTFLLFAYCFFSCFRSMASQFVRARGMVRLFAIDGVVATLTQFLCNLVFMLGLKMGITGYILSFIVSDFISLTMLTVVAGLGKFLDTSFIDKKLIKEMLRYTCPLIPTYLLWWITSASDRIFVIRMVNEAANGVYAVSYKIPTLLMLVTTMFYQAWQMSSIEEKDSETLGSYYKNVYGIYSSLMFTAAAGLIMIVRPLTSLLVSGEGYADAALYSPILIIAMVFQCFCQYLSSIYSVRKLSKNSLMTALVAAVVNIILNLTLIPVMGVYGAAVATAASYFSCYVVRLFDARKYVPFKVDYARLIINTAVVCAMAFVSIQYPTGYNIAVTVGMFVIVFIINFKAVFKTFMKIIGRGKKEAPVE